jgi:hypothetical protein
MPKSAAQKARKREKRKLAKAGGTKPPKQKKKKATKMAAVSRPGMPKAVSGHGDYKSSSDVGKWISKAGGLGGDLISHIFGMGDYQVEYNTLMNAGGPPQFSNNKSDRTTVIRHREFVGSVLSTSAYTLTEYVVNPSNENLFVWLSHNCGFEKYRIHGLIGEFQSTSSDYSAVTGLGQVTMSHVYDVNDSPFPDLITQENYQFTTADKPSNSFLHGVECKNFKQMYLNGGTRVGAVNDARVSDVGRFCISTFGMPTVGVEVGRLWISYEIEFFFPKLTIPVSPQTMCLQDPTGTTKANGSFWSTTGPVPVVVSAANVLKTVFAGWTFVAVNPAVPGGLASTITFYDSRLSGRRVIVEANGICGNATTGQINGISFTNTTYTGASYAATGGGTSTSLLTYDMLVGPGPWVLAILGPTAWGLNPSTHATFSVYA